jgi:prevent-host-death family protein
MTMVSKDRVVQASRFKAECLALMDEVAATGRSLVVTKHGRPIVRVGPVVEPPSLRGSVRFLVGEDELLAPIDLRRRATRG